MRPPGRPPEGSSDRDSSDLVDLQAIAASTRASATPPKVSAAELSGVVPRRDSVVGARVTSAGTGMPPFFWGLIGCLGVLAVGLGLFWYVGVPGVGVGSAPPATPEISVPSVPQVVPGGPQIVPLPARIEPPSPTPPPPPHAEKEKAARHSVSLAAKSAARAAASADRAETPDPGGASTEVPAPPEKSGVLDSLLGAGTAAAPAADPRKEVDAALDELQPKMHECFRRFQIRGVAQVKLTVSPSGSVESPAVTGDFEGTPTGECVLKEVASAALPAFKGSPLNVSHAYVFR